MIEFLLAEAWPYILGALAVVGAIFGYGRHQRKEGRKEVADAAIQARAEQNRRVDEVDKKLSQLDDDDVRRRLNEWVRNPDD